MIIFLVQKKTINLIVSLHYVIALSLSCQGVVTDGKRTKNWFIACITGNCTFIPKNFFTILNKCSKLYTIHTAIVFKINDDIKTGISFITPVYLSKFWTFLLRLLVTKKLCSCHSSFSSFFSFSSLFSGWIGKCYFQFFVQLLL